MCPPRAIFGLRWGLQVLEILWQVRNKHDLLGRWRRWVLIQPCLLESLESCDIVWCELSPQEVGRVGKGGRRLRLRWIGHFGGEARGMRCSMGEWVGGYETWTRWARWARWREFNREGRKNGSKVGIQPSQMGGSRCAGCPSMRRAIGIFKESACGRDHFTYPQPACRVANRKVALTSGEARGQF